MISFYIAIFCDETESGEAVRRLVETTLENYRLVSNGVESTVRAETVSGKCNTFPLDSTTIEPARLQERQLLTFHVVMRRPAEHRGTLKMHPAFEATQYQLTGVTE